MRYWIERQRPRGLNELKGGNGAPEFPFPHPVPPVSGRRARDQGMRVAMWGCGRHFVWPYADMSKGDRIGGYDALC
jgi:hypothetical protein